MKILFLTPPPLDNRPPAERIFGCNYGIYTQPNIFFLYPATILKNAGLDVICLDFAVKAYSPKEFENFCAEQDYDIIFFYTVFLSKNTDLTARDMLQKKNPKTAFIFISTEPSANPDDFINERSMVIRGEPETVILPLVKRLQDGKSLEQIPGISFMSNGEKKETRPGLTLSKTWTNSRFRIANSSLREITTTRS